jgi:hypothetical protein
MKTEGETLVGVVGHASGITGASGIVVTGITGSDVLAEMASVRIVDAIPSGIRWARKADGSTVLQAAYRWRHGWNEGGVEWRDVETVDVSA